MVLFETWTIVAPSRPIATGPGVCQRLRIGGPTGSPVSPVEDADDLAGGDEPIPLGVPGEVWLAP